VLCASPAGWFCQPEQCCTAHTAGSQQVAAHMCLAAVVCGFTGTVTVLLTASSMLCCTVLCDVAFVTRSQE
jgi:hypothetical protein